MDKIFICKEESSNKFWGYTKDPNTFKVEVKWGRLGLEGQKQVKSFNDSWDRDKFIGDKVSDKLHGGYKEVTAEEFEIQTKIAQTLGVGYKIDEIFFVQDDGLYLGEISKKDLHSPNIKPKVYAKVVGRKNKDSDEIPIINFLFDVNSAFRIKLSGTHPARARMSTFSREQIQSGDEYEELAAAVGEVIGRVLL